MKKAFLFMFILIVCVGMAYSQMITLTNPNHLSTWCKGDTYKIMWGKTGSMHNRVKIRLFNSTGTTKILDIINDTANDGSFDWTVPASVASGSYRIRVKTTDNAVSDDSEIFSISTCKKFGLAPKLMVRLLPVIESVFDVPLGALKPGTRLYLKGARFGTKKGKILMYGNFQNSPVEFVNVEWVSSTKVNGYVPQSVNGSPNQNVTIKVKTAGDLYSNGWKMGFEGREQKQLTAYDVRVDLCGDDGNLNVCNNKGTCKPDSICCVQFPICGYHRNYWGAIGDDVGNDIYSIILKNGWTFKSMQKVKWYKSSGDEVLTGPSPPLPVGKSIWHTTIHWKVTPNDRVWYQIKITVEGPIGTNYK